MSKLKPNFTQIPNTILDELLPILQKGELKILLFMARKTYGFHKKKDRISFSQIQKGTKLGKETITRSIESLENKYKILLVDRSKRINSYELNLDYDGSTIIELVPPSNRSSTIVEPKSVPQSNTQNKRNKLNKINSEETSQDTPEKKEFSLDRYILYMEKHDRRDLNIIAMYIRERKKNLLSKILNKDQMGLFIKRHLRAARDLKSYNDKQLIVAVKDVKKKYRNIDWTLETIHKELTK